MSGFSFAQQRAEIEQARAALLAQAAELTAGAFLQVAEGFWL